MIDQSQRQVQTKKALEIWQQPKEPLRLTGTHLMQTLGFI